MKIVKKITFIAIFLYCIVIAICSIASTSVDPIKFTIVSDKSILKDKQEFQITIKASYLSIPNNSVFILDGAYDFKLKLITPIGFIKTGGDFKDYIGASLSASNPSVEYTLTGYFEGGSSECTFQLLRGASNVQSTNLFSQVGLLTFRLQDPTVIEQPLTHARSMSVESGSVMYTTLDGFYNGDVESSDLIYITDSYKEGFFKYVPDSNLADDGALVLEYNSRKYHRIYDGPVNVNWFGIIGDGVTDNTRGIQHLFKESKYTKLYFPKNHGSYRVHSVKIYPNREILFEEGTIVEGLGQLGEFEQMVHLVAVNNITLKGKNVVFKDHRDNYSTGQQRHIFLIKGSKDILIDGISAINGGGDGFYIGTTSTINYSENIKLHNVYANNNRRQGLSIISGRNIEVRDSEFSGSTGAGSESGIDIECNEPSDILENIKIINVKTRNNSGSGILIAPIALSGTGKMIDIMIKNHDDEGSRIGAQVASVTSALGGYVIFETPVWKNSRQSAFIARNWSYRGPMVQVLNSVAINPNTSDNTSANYGAAYLIYRAPNDLGDDNIGNVHLINPSIQEYSELKRVRTAYCFRDISKGLNILNCSLMNPIKSSIGTNKNLIAHNGELTVVDSDGALAFDMGDYTRYINNWTYNSLLHNQSSKVLRVLRLDKMVPNFPEVTVEVRNKTGIRIIPATTDNILPLSKVHGKYITSTELGSRIILKKISKDSWVVKEVIGTWVVQP